MCGVKHVKPTHYATTDSCKLTVVRGSPERGRKEVFTVAASDVEDDGESTPVGCWDADGGLEGWLKVGERSWRIAQGRKTCEFF